MVRFAVVEDDPKYAECMKEYLFRYQKEKNCQLSVTMLSDGLDIVEHYKSDYDIILMDIEMDFMNGMEAAREIRKMDQQVVIMFVTNVAQYAVQGYEVEALDYIIKPVSYYPFSQRIERAIKRLERRTTSWHYISCGKNGTRKTSVMEICFVEVCRHTLIYHLTDTRIETTGSMADVEQKLDSRMFFRCNKGYLVNLDYVESVQDDFAVVHGETVQISRSKKKAFMDALNDYVNEVGK